ncbi:MAG TPA: hypothetical protein DCM54_04685 [Gammaproteobacteria bacterium]|nr:hypothetical protein [Gammaproteobacteria bacterium]
MSQVDPVLNLDLPPFEPVNRRRGGWSGVAMVTCANKSYFIKRQKNHSYRELRRGFRRTPTLRREYRNTLRLQALGIPTPEIVRYQETNTSGFLITRQLNGFQNLENYLLAVEQSFQRNHTMAVVAQTLLRMHLGGLHHGCLYGKHVMVKPGVQPQVALIDLETLRFTVRKVHNAAKDISQLVRHTAGFSENDVQIISPLYEMHLPGFTELLGEQLANLKKYSVHLDSD